MVMHRCGSLEMAGVCCTERLVSAPTLAIQYINESFASIVHNLWEIVTLETYNLAAETRKGIHNVKIRGSSSSKKETFGYAGILGRLDSQLGVLGNHSLSMMATEPANQ